MHDIRFFAKPEYKTSWALIVGIDNYENAAPLSYAVSDATEIRDQLIRELAFSRKNITYLIDGEATKGNILKSFMRFACDDVELDDRIFVFFAGHGHTRAGRRGEVGYLVAFDSDPDDLSTYIRWDDLTRNSDLIRAKHMLFIMDACYGGLALTRGLQAGSTRFVRDMMIRYSRQVLTAGKADEVVADAGGPLPNHSIFTGHLIEGLRGKAAASNGVITASGLMAYVYQQVATDKNSNQTPHYGYFDGDGDFIFRGPSTAPSDGQKKDVDELFVVPFSETAHSLETTEQKIATTKRLLSNNASSIELHDFVISEVTRFLTATSEDNFAIQGEFRADDLSQRITNYEHAVFDMAEMLACISYWGSLSHKHILQKALSRSTDRLGSQSGTVAWLHLRWYPLIVMLYSAGIASVDGERYDSLSDIFYTQLGTTGPYEKEKSFVEAVTTGMLELTRLDLFKRLPGYERNYTPLSEYLFKILQPHLDDLLFIGKDYERAFDEFEILLALVTADLKIQKGEWLWGPIGRFGWKHRNYIQPPLTRVIEEAKATQNDWPPLKSGLFGGSFQRFQVTAEQFQKEVSNLNWW